MNANWKAKQESHGNKARSSIRFSTKKMPIKISNRSYWHNTKTCLSQTKTAVLQTRHNTLNADYANIKSLSAFRLLTWRNKATRFVIRLHMMLSKALAKKISAWLVKVRISLLISEPVSKPMLKKQMLGLTNHSRAKYYLTYSQDTGISITELDFLHTSE